MGVQTPNPTVNADARRRGFARTAVAGYLVVGHLLSEDRYDRLGSNCDHRQTDRAQPNADSRIFASVAVCCGKDLKSHRRTASFS